MARCCGSTGTCACKIDSGRHIEITGSGKAGDPFVISAQTLIAVEGNDSFDLGLSGLGTLAEPWILTLRYADTAKLKDLPDVSDTAPTNTQVLGWNSSTSKWEPKAAATASPGAVAHNTSLTGDGSGGNPLMVNVDEAGGLILRPLYGLGLDDATTQQLVRPFINGADRASMTPGPATGSLSIVLTNPGQVDYWDGSSWQPITNGLRPKITGQFMALSGSYTSGTLFNFVKQRAVTTAADGTFDVITSSDLATYAGVISVNVQETSNTIGWKCMVYDGGDRVKGKAYRLDNGAALTSTPITLMVNAILY